MLRMRDFICFSPLRTELQLKLFRQSQDQKEVTKLLEDLHKAFTLGNVTSKEEESIVENRQQKTDK